MGVDARVSGCTCEGMRAVQVLWENSIGADGCGVLSAVLDENTTLGEWLKSFNYLC